MNGPGRHDPLAACGLALYLLVTHLQERGTATRIAEAVVDSGKRAKPQLQEQTMRQGYGMLAKVLAVSEQDEDRALARAVGMLADRANETTRPQQRHRESGRGER